MYSSISDLELSELSGMLPTYKHEVCSNTLIYRTIVMYDCIKKVSEYYTLTDERDVCM